MTKFVLNGQAQDLNSDPEMPLLWVLRDELSLNGTKYGCGMARCGACTILIDGIAVRSCVTPLLKAEGKNITTIEGLGEQQLHALQLAWIEENVPQCGYCQSGQIMSAAALVAAKPQPTDDEIAAAMSGNLCRCGTYPRIQKAIKRATGQ